MSPNKEMPNDFGKPHPLLLVYGREAVESRKAIRISQVLRSDAWQDRNVLLYRFRINNFDMKLVRDRLSSELYIELLTLDSTGSNPVINLKTTRCHFGGCRYWFECSECEKPVGVLYKDNESFKCRKCLDLDYRSHEVNYKSIEPAIRYMNKVNKMIDTDEWFPRFYKGKPTKKYLRFDKLREKADAGFAFFGPRYLKEK